MSRKYSEFCSHISGCTASIRNHFILPVVGRLFFAFFLPFYLLCVNKSLANAVINLFSRVATSRCVVCMECTGTNTQETHKWPDIWMGINVGDAVYSSGSYVDVTDNIFCVCIRTKKCTEIIFTSIYIFIYKLSDFPFHLDAFSSNNKLQLVFPTFLEHWSKKYISWFESFFQFWYLSFNRKWVCILNR